MNTILMQVCGCGGIVCHATERKHILTGWSMDPAFSDDERNLIVNYAYKWGTLKKQGSLQNISMHRKCGRWDVALAMIDAEAEIDALRIAW